MSDILDHHGLKGDIRAEIARVIRHLFIKAKEAGLSDLGITDDFLMDFLLNELPQTNSGSMRRSLLAIRYVSQYFQAQGIGNLTLDFGQLHVKGSRVNAIPPFSPEEISRILGVIDVNTNMGLRDYAIIILAVDTGLRGSDIRTARLSDIDWKKGRIFVNQKKTSEPLILPLSAKTMNAVADYILKARPECDYDEIFLNVKGPARPMGKKHQFSQMIDKYCKAAGIDIIEKRKLHSVRRTFATELSKAGVSVETISQFLGHHNINADKPYYSYNTEQISHCSLGFEGITIKSGVYRSTSEGGDQV